MANNDFLLLPILPFFHSDIHKDMQLVDHNIDAYHSCAYSENYLEETFKELYSACLWVNKPFFPVFHLPQYLLLSTLIDTNSAVGFTSGCSI